MLYRLGLLMVRHRWLVVAAWASALVLALVFAPRVVSVLKSGFGEVDTESRQALDLMEGRLGIPESSLTLVFSSPDLLATDPAFIAEMERTLAPLALAPEVTSIGTHYGAGNAHMVSQDGHAAYALVRLDVPIDLGVDRYDELRDTLRSDALDLLVTGGIPIFAEVDEYSAEDLRRAEAIAFPLVLIALVLVFGSAVAAGLPLMIGAISVVLTMAAVYGIGRVTDMSIFSLNIATFLGLGIAVDYSLLVVSRFREEMPFRPRSEAVAVTMATAGRALLFSGLTTVLGLSGLMLFQFMMLRSIGVAGILVVALSLLLALTLLPAVLGLLGPRVNALAVIRLRPDGGGAWRRLALWVMRHPLLVILPVTLLLLVLGTPFLRVNIGAPWASILPPESEARRGWEMLEDRFGLGEASPVIVVARADGPILGDPHAIGGLYDLAQRLQDDPGVRRVESVVTLDPAIGREGYQQLYLRPGDIPTPAVRRAVAELVGGDTTLLRVYEANAPLSAESKALVRRIRGMASGSGLEVYVTGATADTLDAVGVIYRDFPWIVAYVLVAIALALFWLFRSVVLPLKAVLMNAMSIFASYGALVFIFQEGHLEGLLGFRAEGYTESTLPVLMFCILFGLSMDYEVFLLSRIKEAHDGGADNTTSVAQGLERTGRVITSAALVLVLVLGAFATGQIMYVKALGVGMAIAISLDATVVRALLVPAVMRLLGPWNWWAPAFLGGRARPQRR